MSRTPQTPSLARRLTAMVYDALLVIAAVAVANGLALGVQVQLLGSANHALHPGIARGLIVFTVYGFFILFWLAGGQTLGMQAWRLKLVSSDGGKPTFKQSLARCVGATLSALCLGGGYLWCLVDARGRYWHDYLSGTELVLLPKKGDSNSVEDTPGEA